MTVVSLDSNGNPKAEVGPKDGDITVIGLIMFFFGGIWTLGVWVRKTVGCLNHCLMGHTSRSMEDSGTKSDLNCGGLTQKV